MATSVQTRPTTAPGDTEDQRREDAQLYVHRLRAFSIHAAVCAASLVVIVAVNLAVNAAAGITGEWWAWRSGWALIGWVLGLMVHGLVVRASRPNSSTSTWEEDQINKILASEDATPLR